MDLPRRAAVRRYRPARAVACFLALAALAVPGCRGCNQAEDPAVEAEKKKPEKKPEEPKKPFETPRLTVLPATEELDALHPAKPGHWTNATMMAKANLFDFAGLLETTAQDLQSRSLDLDRTAYRLSTSRGATLPKGQAKNLDLTFFLPPGHKQSIVSAQLRERHGGAEAIASNPIIDQMPAFQYHLVVLSRNRERYNYVERLDSVRPPSGETDENGKLLVVYYRVARPKVDQRVLLPADPLCWSSIAYILWDDVYPQSLKSEQQQAMLDWLHWGGQLIVSGPATLDLLAGSFLDPFLPAVAAKDMALDAAALAPLNEHWTLPEGFGPSRPLSPRKPWSGVQLERRPDGSFLPDTGELLAERRVGRGRVVVTAFRLSEPELIRWRSFDSFFNACLLRRDAREFTQGPQLNLLIRWANRTEDWLDPRLITGVRFFSRDAGVPARSDYGRSERTTLSEEADPFGQPNYAFNLDAAVSQAKQETGAAGWNDFGEVSSAARQSLKEAAGITIPKPEFVFWMLSVYLLVLLPVNWTVFRIMGRVEWAWLAVPVIALAAAFVVIRMAQVDIGFASSKTEIATLEIQGGYPRAHLTRYIALYTSLSKSYDLQLDDTSGLALPLGSDVELLSGQSRGTVTLRRDGNIVLTGYEIASNSTGMLHSEQMVDLQGALTASRTPDGRAQVTNGTKLTLSGAAVIHRPPNGEPRGAWIGELAPGETAVVSLESFSESFMQRNESDTTANEPPRGALSLAALVKIAERQTEINRGDTRLVAWIGDELPGASIQPAASQSRAATLVVANLEYGMGAPPIPDKSLRYTIRPYTLEEALKEEEPTSPPPPPQ